MRGIDPELSRHLGQSLRLQVRRRKPWIRFEVNFSTFPSALACARVWYTNAQAALAAPSARVPCPRLQLASGASVSRVAQQAVQPSSSFCSSVAQRLAVQRNQPRSPVFGFANPFCRAPVRAGLRQLVSAWGGSHPASRCIRSRVRDPAWPAPARAWPVPARREPCSRRPNRLPMAASRSASTRRRN